MCIYLTILQQASTTRACKTTLMCNLYSTTIRNTCVRTNLNFTILITQYSCKTLINCMVGHRRPFFRSLERGHSDCDPIWCCVDDKRPEFFFRGDVTRVASLVIHVFTISFIFSNSPTALGATTSRSVSVI